MQRTLPVPPLTTPSTITTTQGSAAAVRTLPRGRVWMLLGITTLANLAVMIGGVWDVDFHRAVRVDTFSNGCGIECRATA